MSDNQSDNSDAWGQARAAIAQPAQPAQPAPEQVSDSPFDQAIRLYAQAAWHHDMAGMRKGYMALQALCSPPVQQADAQPVAPNAAPTGRHRGGGEAMSPEQIIERMRYMGRLYAAAGRGGSTGRHYLEDAADIMEQQAAEIARLHESYCHSQQNFLNATEEVSRLRSTVSEFHHAMKDAGWHPGRTDDNLCDIIRAKGEELKTLTAERDALRVDAERYRYLRNRVPVEVFDARGLKAGAWIDCEDDAGQLTLLTGEDADRDIDAARAAREST